MIGMLKFTRQNKNALTGLRVKIPGPKRRSQANNKAFTVHSSYSELTRIRNLKSMPCVSEMQYGGG